MQQAETITGLEGEKPVEQTNKKAVPLRPKSKLGKGMEVKAKNVDYRVIRAKANSLTLQVRKIHPGGTIFHIGENLNIGGYYLKAESINREGKRLQIKARLRDDIVEVEGLVEAAKPTKKKKKSAKAATPAA